MKTVVLFGAGQIGAMVSRLMGPEYRVACFADNNRRKWGGTLAGIQIVSPAESLLFFPDCFCLCVLDDERASEMEAQIRELGFDGPVLRPDALKTFDARAATMRLLAEQILEKEIPGAVAELGVFRGDFAALINAAFPDRVLHLFDTFDAAFLGAALTRRSAADPRREQHAVHRRREGRPGILPGKGASADAGLRPARQRHPAQTAVSFQGTRPQSRRYRHEKHEKTGAKQNLGFSPCPGCAAGLRGSAAAPSGCGAFRAL